MNSLADKYLSKHGRYGDTEMYHTSEGETWHVNPSEKNMMESLGPIGERIVGEIGSGTINPVTGLKEQWLPWVIAALTVVSSAASGNKAAMGAAGSAEMAQAGLDSLGKSNRQAKKTYESSMDMIKETHDKSQSQISKKTSFSAGDLQEQSSKVAGKTRMPTGGSDASFQKAYDRLAFEYEATSDSLSANTAREAGKVTGEYEGKVAENRAKANVLQVQKKMYDEQADSWYLGKYLGGVFGLNDSVWGKNKNENFKKFLNL